MTTENATKQEVISGSEDQEVGIREVGFRFGKSGPGLQFSGCNIQLHRSMVRGGILYGNFANHEKHMLHVSPDLSDLRNRLKSDSKETKHRLSGLSAGFLLTYSKLSFTCLIPL